MATIKMVDIVSACSIALLDVANGRWSKSELLSYGNDGQREIVKYRPDASAVHRKFQLAAGSVQAIPAGDLRLLRPVRNMGLDGNTPGRAIRVIAKDDLDRQNPNWHTATASATVERIVFDAIDPKVFYAYPPQPGAGMGYVEIIVSTVPADCTINGVNGANADTVISLDDIYKDDLFNFIMFKAQSKDAEYITSGAAAQFKQMFMTSMTGKAQADDGSVPAKAEK